MPRCIPGGGRTAHDSIKSQREEATLFTFSFNPTDYTEGERLGGSGAVMSVTSLHVLISLQYKEKVNLKPGGLADGSIYLELINLVSIPLCSVFLYLLYTGSGTGSVNFILK